MNNKNITLTSANIYTAITRTDVNNLRRGQTVLIETNYKKDESGQAVIESKRIMLGNFTRRSDAYYNCFIFDNYKHKRGEHEYRLLKLYRALEEVDATPELPVEWLKSSNYKEDPAPAPAPAEAASEEAMSVSNDVPATASAEVTAPEKEVVNTSNDGTEEVGEVIIDERVAVNVDEKAAANVDEPKKKNKRSKKSSK